MVIHQITILRAVARTVMAFLSLPGPLAGKISSLLTRSENLAQRFDFIRDCRFRRADWGSKTKYFPAVARLAGKGSEHAHSQDAVDRIEAGQYALADQVATNSPTGASVAGTKPIIRSLPQNPWPPHYRVPWRCRGYPALTSNFTGLTTNSPTILSFRT